MRERRRQHLLVFPPPIIYSFPPPLLLYLHHTQGYSLVISDSFSFFVFLTAAKKSTRIFDKKMSATSRSSDVDIDGGSDVGPDTADAQLDCMCAEIVSAYLQPPPHKTSKVADDTSAHDQPDTAVVAASADAATALTTAKTPKRAVAAKKKTTKKKSKTKVSKKSEKEKKKHHHHHHHHHHRHRDGDDDDNAAGDAREGKPRHRHHHRHRHHRHHHKEDDADRDNDDATPETTASKKKKKRTSEKTKKKSHHKTKGDGHQKHDADEDDEDGVQPPPPKKAKRMASRKPGRPKRDEQQGGDDDVDGDEAVTPQTIPDPDSVLPGTHPDIDGSSATAAKSKHRRSSASMPKSHKARASASSAGEPKHSGAKAKKRAPPKQTTKPKTKKKKTSSGAADAAADGARSTQFDPDVDEDLFGHGLNVDRAASDAVVQDADPGGGDRPDGGGGTADQTPAEPPLQYASQYLVEDAVVDSTGAGSVVLPPRPPGPPVDMPRLLCPTVTMGARARMAGHKTMLPVAVQSSDAWRPYALCRDLAAVTSSIRRVADALTVGRAAASTTVVHADDAAAALLTAVQSIEQISGAVHSQIADAIHASLVRIRNPEVLGSGPLIPVRPIAVHDRPEAPVKLGLSSASNSASRSAPMAGRGGSTTAATTGRGRKKPTH